MQLRHVETPARFCLSLIKKCSLSANFYCPKLTRSRLSHILFNSEALFEEDGSIDHHIDVVLRLGQRMVVVVDVHLDCFAQCLDKFR